MLPLQEDIWEDDRTHAWMQPYYLLVSYSRLSQLLNVAISGTSALKNIFETFDYKQMLVMIKKRTFEDICSTKSMGWW